LAVVLYPQHDVSDYLGVRAGRFGAPVCLLIGMSTRMDALFAFDIAKGKVINP
jgi:hypothetical protein